MENSRRKFLQTGSLLAAGALVGSNKLFAEASAHKLKKFGIQLWSVRDDMAKDPKGTLQQLANYGYKLVESCDSANGFFWGMKNAEFKTSLADMGLQCFSTHTNVYENFDKKSDDAVEAGLKYIIYNWEGAGKTLDDYKKMADDFNKKGELCKSKDIRFAFHNHDFTFKPIDGVLAQNILMDNTDPSLVYFEMDIYWVVTAGANPVEWFQKHNGRFKLCHIKDRTKNSKEQFDSCNLGIGSIDFATILPVARKCGMEYFYVEQEKWEGSTPMLSAQADAEYMKMIRV